MENNILRERPIPGCDSVITPQPLRTFIRQGDELIPVEIDMSRYKRIGFNKDFDYLTLIETK
jgi:hypothetical protein